MMRFPDGKIIRHVHAPYDPQKAREYYLRTRHLKGRRHGSAQPVKKGLMFTGGVIQKKQHQKKALTERIHSLQDKLHKLEDRIRKMEHEAASEDRKSKAKDNRAAKEADKPKSAAEKAKLNRDNKKYREKHKQELKTKSKESGSISGGSSSETSSSSSSAPTVDDLKSLATKVKGQIAVAKQKLATL